ncbi:MAG: hypothetical protein ACOC3A_03555 [Thermodesulfobacteriota bacterium]
MKRIGFEELSEDDLFWMGQTENPQGPGIPGALQEKSLSGLAKAAADIPEDRPLQLRRFPARF